MLFAFLPLSFLFLGRSTQSTKEELYSRLRHRCYRHMRLMREQLSKVYTADDLAKQYRSISFEYKAIAELVIEAGQLPQPPPKIDQQGRDLSEDLYYEIERVSSLVGGKEQLYWMQAEALQKLKKHFGR